MTASFISKAKPIRLSDKQIDNTFNIQHIQVKQKNSIELHQNYSNILNTVI